MALFLFGKKKLIKRRNQDDEVVIEGDLRVTGTSTLPGIADPDVTAADTTFDVGTDLTVGNDVQVDRDVNIDRDLAVGRILKVEGTSVGITVEDTTNNHKAKVVADNDTVQVGAESDSDLELVTDDTARLTIANSGEITIPGDVEINGEFLLSASAPVFEVTDSDGPTTVQLKPANSSAQIGTKTNHPLHLMTNDTNVLTLSAAGAVTAAGAVNVTGVLAKLGANGQSLNIKEATGTKTTNSGTDTETISNAIPAGAKVLGVSARVTTALSGVGLTTWKLGDAGDDDRYGATLSKNVNTTVTQANATADPAGTWSASARDLILKAAAGQFDAGVLRWSVMYTDVTAPTS